MAASLSPSSSRPIADHGRNGAAGRRGAYDFFNAELFGGSLPHVLVTLQRHAKARGYFSPERFTGRGKATTTAHELAMNPDGFTGRDDEEILSTLAQLPALAIRPRMDRGSKGQGQRLRRRRQETHADYQQRPRRNRQNV
jgi:hypothetical protein